MTTETRDLELETHLRRTLTAVAETVQGEPSRPARRIGRRTAIGLGAAAVVVPLAAAAVVGFGPEYVDEIPPANPLLSGSVDGDRYWLVDARQVPTCDGTDTAGLELVIESNNIVGREWNTFGLHYGEPSRDQCAPLRLPRDPAVAFDAGGFAGDTFLWHGAVHPDVTEVRATLDGGELVEVPLLEHEEAGYYVLEVPEGTDRFTVELLDDGVVIPGSMSEHTVPVE